MKKKHEPIKIFISYSHKDEKLKNELENHLSALKRQKIIDTWHDREIGPGDEWNSEISNHLKEANIILLLISPDFLASDYCNDIELKYALEQHKKGNVKVIPIFLRMVDWSGFAFSSLQGLPKDAKPITSWENYDEAFYNVAYGIRKVARKIVNDKKILQQNSSTKKYNCNHTDLKTDNKKWMLVLSAEINEVDKPRAEAIIEHLCRLTDYPHFTLVKITEGSVKIFIKGSQENFDTISSLFHTGKLNSIFNIKIEDVKSVTEGALYNEIEKEHKITIYGDDCLEEVRYEFEKVKKETNFIMEEISTELKEYNEITEEYITSLRKHYELAMKQKYLENDIPQLEIIINDIIKNIDNINRSQSLLNKTNINLSETLDEIKERNKFLEDLKHRLKDHLNIILPSFVQFNPIEQIQPQLLSMPTNITQVKFGYSMDISRVQSQLLGEFAAISAGNEFSQIIKWSDLDFYSTIKIQIDIISEINEHYSQYKDYVNHSSQIIRKKINDIKSLNKHIALEIKKVENRKEKLEDQLRDLKEKLSNKIAEYKDAIKQYSSIFDEYHKEYEKQINLLETIGKLEIEKKKKSTTNLLNNN